MLNNSRYRRMRTSLNSAHPLMKWADYQVSNSEMSNFLQDQGSQGARRPAPEGREQLTPQTDAACPAIALAKAEDCEKGPFLDGH